MKKTLKYFCLIVLLSFIVSTKVMGQQGLTVGSSVEKLPVTKILNNRASINSLAEVTEGLTIIDFFGTWCAPCIRALPLLDSLKQQYKAKLNIVLVSNESEAQLSKFIKARKDFSFPVIVDDNNQWNKTFQPPALPYTVIVKQGKVIAITKAEELSKTNIEQWIRETPLESLAAVNNNSPKIESNNNTIRMNKKSSNAAVEISQEFIYAAKTGDSLDALSSQLKMLDYTQLLKSLLNDDLKKAFWINIYNGFTQASLKAHPDQYKDRGAFFKKKQINVAGEQFSLDDIEHGILRRSKSKWSLGYFNKLFPSRREKQLRVEKIDYRIHFALNCGAKSCPPVAFYNPDNLNSQLDVATKAYLTGEASYDEGSNKLFVPKLMSWFRADFGGKKGIVAIAKKVGLIAKNAKPEVEFKEYDWSLELDNYKVTE